MIQALGSGDVGDDDWRECVVGYWIRNTRNNEAKYYRCEQSSVIGEQNLANRTKRQISPTSCRKIKKILLNKIKKNHLKIVLLDKNVKQM